jgi:DNA-binding NarL/FixJ family response regulator
MKKSTRATRQADNNRRQTAKLTNLGYSADHIASVLNVAVSTVKTYIREAKQ